MPILESSGCLPRDPKPDQHRRAPSAEDVVAKNLKESASAQTWRKTQRMTESISDTEYPDGIDTGGFKQTESPADGRSWEGKGLFGVSKSDVPHRRPVKGPDFMAELLRVKNADYPYHDPRHGLHEMGTTSSLAA